MKKLPNAVKWLIILAVLALMGWMLVQVNDRASRVKMPDPDNSLGIYRSADSQQKILRFCAGFFCHSEVMMNQNVVPLPTVLCTPKRKPCCWKMAFVMDRPRPVPCLPASERER